MKIQAALITVPQQPIHIETLDLDPPRAGEVLVQIKACGVCHSDYHLITGAPRIEIERFDTNRLLWSRNEGRRNFHR